MHDIQHNRIPRHIAMIMDGNGRWAEALKLPKSAGHKKGAGVARKITKICKELGVEYLTLFTFSSENWSRPKEEVDYLMNLLRSYLSKSIRDLIRDDIRIRFIGDRSALPVDIGELMEQCEVQSLGNRFNLILAVNYGGRLEIQQAVEKMANDIVAGRGSRSIEQYLYTNDIPDPDLLIRTSGEHRVSNFLLWQIAYAELYFTDTLWPDFSKKELLKAIQDFSFRQRRFGGR